MTYKTPYLNILLGPVCWRSPLLSWLPVILRQQKNLLTCNYDILIDGYPRSANTFTVTTFRFLFPHLRIRSHMHTPAAVIQAARAGKPVLLLIRNPIDAITSWVVYTSYRPEYAVMFYVHYYSVALRYANRLMIADFDEVTSNITDVISRVTARCGEKYSKIGLRVIDKTDIFKAIDQAFKEKNGLLDELKVPRPSKERKAAGEDARKSLEAIRQRGGLDRAERIYQELTRIKNTQSTQNAR